MKKIIIRIMSNGCPSCIATAIPHLLRIKGVRGARVIGMNMVVLTEDWLDPEIVVKDSALNTYYRVLSWSIEELGEIRVDYALRPIH